MGALRVHSIRFSLVIPAHNEADYLPQLLDTVDAARRRYRGGEEAIEVVVADNASTDVTAEVARARGCRVAYVEKRAIAAARNGGARIARGAVVCFTDADMRIHPDTFNAIDDALATGKYVGGATGVRLERMSLGLAAAYAMMIPMVWVMGMDTGVVFCRREDFDAIGGYDENLLCAEDVRFLLDLKRVGRSRRQKLARCTSAKAICSTRKFDEHGEWHYVKMLLTAPFYFVFSRKAFEKFARRYWYDNQR
ncbi:MAG TPA: glycosyltransferase [Candidatus Hydrogenedentes bacterium]|nr:glycosyltransferase [Candidatus Hydrogenedentota bacterium]